MSTAEVFSLDKVKSVMNEIESEFSDLSKVIEETNTEITTALGSPEKAVYGDAGNKILATWDENCSTLSSFIKIYDNWSSMVVSIATEYGELDKGTAKVEGTDIDSFKTISGANKTTWLSTPEGSKNYTGSTSSYTPSNTDSIVSEKSSLNNKREATYTNSEGVEITEYYNLAGELIGYKKNNQYYDTNNKSVSAIGTKEELEMSDKVKTAQSSLKESLTTKSKEKKERDEERENRFKTTDMMQKVSNTAINNSGGGYDGSCEYWAEVTWQNATGIQRQRMEGAYQAWEKFGVSTSRDNIPVGAMVYGSGSGSAGAQWGHVAIYIGDGKVADQGGVTDIDTWLSWQTANCHGHTGYIGWGWQNNIDLTKV